jgi:hypothetical protein
MDFEEKMKMWEELVGKATPGPWAREGGRPPAVTTKAHYSVLNSERDFLNAKGEKIGTLVGVCVGLSNPDSSSQNWYGEWQDLEFIAASREAMPELISEVRRLQKVVDMLMDQKR